MEIRIGTTGDYPPVSCQDPVTGAFFGEDIEVAKQLARALGGEAVFVKTAWKTLCDDLENGLFDMALSGITDTPERRRRALVSIGYRDNGKTLLCRSADADRFKSLDDADKEEITVVENRGGTNEAFAKARFRHCRIMICEENTQALLQILAEKADVMITDIIEAKYQATLHPELAAPLSALPFTRDRCCVLVSRSHEDWLPIIDRELQKRALSESC